MEDASGEALRGPEPDGLSCAARSSLTGRASRWFARVASLGVLYAVANHFARTGIPDPWEASTPQILAAFFLTVGAAGLVIGWRWEGAGGIVAVSSGVLGLLVSLLGSAEADPGWTPSSVAVCGFLFMLSRALNVAATHETGVRTGSGSGSSEG